MRWPTWADLRVIGNSGAVRASIIVPVIGYMIILNATLAEYLKLHGVEWAHQPATFWDRLWSLKLYFIYFGLMFLGVGAAIYQWRCPSFVKKYSDWADYVAGLATHTDTSQIEVLAKILKRQPYADSGTSMDDRLRLYLRMHFSLMSNSDWGWRVVTAILFAAGFALLVIPSAMTIARVAIAFVSGP